jgi:outer membrane protein assembly factor BamD
MPVRLGVLVLAALLMGGCGSSGPTTFSSAQEAYDRATTAYEEERYERAIEYFRATLDFGRTGELADDAQLLLARAYAADRQYLLAGNEYTRFIEFYRADPRVEQAAYERIEAYAALSPRYELDQTDTRQALTYVALFEQQFPQSEFVDEVAAVADRLREKLARKQYEAGRLYERREMYEAAAYTFRQVLADFPTSEYADDALFGALRSLTLYAENSIQTRQSDRFRDALAVYDQMTTLFPQSALLEDAQDWYDRAYSGLQEVGGDVAGAATSGR